MRRADRLINMVHFLRRKRQAVTAEVIAEEFGICTRTVYRDMHDLISTGAPIRGEAGVGYMIDQHYYLPPLTFTVEEFEALGLGLSMVRQWTDGQFADQAATAMIKIKAALPKDLQGELEQITSYSMPNFQALPWTVSFSDLRESIREQKKVCLRYCDAVQSETMRTVRPLALIFGGSVWLLAAWCERRWGFRHFRLDRIIDLHCSREVFADDKDKNLTAYHAHRQACDL